MPCRITNIVNFPHLHILNGFKFIYLKHCFILVSRYLFLAVLSPCCFLGLLWLGERGSTSCVQALLARWLPCGGAPGAGRPEANVKAQQLCLGGPRHGGGGLPRTSDLLTHVLCVGGKRPRDHQGGPDPPHSLARSRQPQLPG